MPLYCEVDSNNYQYVIEAVPLTQVAALDENQLIRRLIEHTAKIREHHEANISKYGKLIGQGRIGLLELMDNLFICLVLLNENFKQKTRKAFETFQNKSEFRVLMENRNNKYSASGLINEKDVHLPNNFSRVFNELLVERIKKVLMLYKEGVRVDSPEEKIDELYTIMDALLYIFIIIRFNIVKCNIDR